MPNVLSGFSSFGIPFLFNSPDLVTSANRARKGDKFLPRSLEKFQLAELAEMGLEIPQSLGDTKLIPMTEFFTARRERIDKNWKYYNIQPPTPNLDKEDPNRDMLRVFPPIPREVIDKGAQFLFGAERFDGFDAFIFEKSSQRFKNQFRDFWRDNKMDTLIKRIARTTLWAGDCFLKFHSEIETITTLDVPEDIMQEDIKMSETKSAKIDVRLANPKHFHAITEKDNPINTLVWIHQFQRTDKTFFREEIFRDVTYVYEGIKKEEVAQARDSRMNIAGSGLSVGRIETKTEFIEFTLVKVIEYPDFNDFPLVIFKHDPDNDMYGNSVYTGLYGKFDALNDLFTRAFFAFQNQATPILVGYGIKEATTEHDVHQPDAMWCFPDADAKVDVIQWEGVPKPFFEFIGEIRDQIYRKAGVPKSEDLQAFTNVSGEALNVINGSIIDVTDDRRGNFEEGFRQLVKLVRKANGQPKEIEKTMALRWGPVFPESKERFNEHLLALFREEIVRGEYVIEANRLIPDHEKQELAKTAEDMQLERERLKEEAILAQSQGGQGGGGAQSMRVTQRAGGQTAERSKSKPKPGGKK